MLSAIAHIGGQGFPKSSADSEIGVKIDTYDVDNQKEELTVATMEFNRKQFSCALIAKGSDGNPTVAICKIRKKKLGSETDPTFQNKNQGHRLT